MFGFFYLIFSRWIKIIAQYFGRGKMLLLLNSPFPQIVTIFMPVYTLHAHDIMSWLTHVYQLLERSNWEGGYS